MQKLYALTALVFLVVSSAIAQKNVGINTNDPKSTFDVNGNLALREGPALVLSNGGASGGANDNIVLPDVTGSTGVKASFYRITGPTAPFSLFGIVPTTGADGQIVTLVNTTTQVMTIKNNASSVPANAFKTLTGGDMVTVAGMSSVTLQYNKTDSRWYVTGSENFTVSSTTLPTKDIVSGVGSAVSIVNGTNQVVGGGNVVVDVATNGLGQKGVVPGPTGLNSSQVWGTDGSGNPAWAKLQNAQMQNSSVTVNTGTGLSGGGNVALGGTLNLVNTAPDQTVAISSGSGISATGTYPNFTVTNTGDLSSTNEAQTLAGSGTTDINLTQAGGVGGGTVTLQGSGATSVSRSGNTFTISSSNSGGTVTSVSATSPISVTSPTTTPNISMTQAGSGSNGWLSSTDWNSFNGRPTGTGTATQVTFWSSGSGLSSDGNLYWDNTNKRLGIGTAGPVDRLDVRDAMSVNEIKFRNVGGGDDSDPYRLRKVNSGSNTNWLELQLNDDPNEEFRIYGNSCVGYGCAEYSGNLYHYFRADGTAWHAGTVTGNYFNSADNTVSSGVTGIVVKAGDNNHRTATAAAVLSFLGITAPTGDNLGNHTATTTLNMNNQAITNIVDAYNSGWWRNNNAGQGLYNQSTGRHFYSESGTYWTAASADGLIFRNGLGGTITGYVYWDGTAGSNNFGLLSPNGNWRFRDDNSNTEAYGGFYNGTQYSQVIYDRDNTGYYLDLNNGSNSNVFTANESYVNGWFRVNTTGGIYWQNYGGGWNMQDVTWLRTYGNKGILASGGLAGYGNVFGGQYGGTPRIYGNYDNAGGGGVAIADDGGFYDFNDGYVEFRGSTGLAIRVDNGATGLLMRMTNTGGGSISDHRIITDNNAWGLVGASGNAFWQFWGYSYNNASTRESKKDITEVSGAVAAKVMEDLDKMHPYLYRYNVESDEMIAGQEAKYRPGLHMGLIVDESPDYIQSQSYDGIDIYAAATLGVTAAKVNRSDIKEIKNSMGWDENNISVQDFGSVKVSSEETWVPFENSFSAKLNGTVPVITLTGNKQAGEMYITEKTDKGFRVKVAGDYNGLQLDYIAMAKVQHSAPKADEIPASTLSKMYVTAEQKQKAYAGTHKPENSEAAIKEKAQKEAVQVQKQRHDEIYGSGAITEDPSTPAFDVKKDAEAKKRKADEDKKTYVAVPEDAPQKNRGEEHPKVVAPASDNR